MSRTPTPTTWPVMLGALATPATAALYRHRLGHGLKVRTIDYRTSVPFGDVRLTVYPAGHCLGSAMLHVDNGQESLLYTGDFKLGASLTAQTAEIPQADVLIMESTFGKPRYRMPPREQVVGQLIESVREAFAVGSTPVIHAYAVGKAQEVSALLTQAGIPVLQHPVVYGVSQVYRACGIDFRGASGADIAEYTGRPLVDHAVVTLPKRSRGFRLSGLGTVYSMATTGWAIDSATRHRWDVDLAVPLSDHADFDELLECVERASPQRVYCTHGPAEFVDHLRDRGIDAYPLVDEQQRRLF